MLTHYQTAPVPAESDAESVASGQVTPRANPSDQAKDELADTIMKDSKAQIEDDPEDQESEAATDDEEYVPEKILTHRADFDLVSSTSRVPCLERI